MTTLRRDLIQKIKEVLIDYLGGDSVESASERIADSVLDLRTFKSKEDYDKTNWGLEWGLSHGEEVKQEALDSAKLIEIALNAFESDLQLPANWNWYPVKEEKTWKEFREFVVKLYKEDPNSFARYQTWRMQPYSSGRMSNRAIKARPDDFPASWSDFCAADVLSKPRGASISKDSNDAPVTYS